MENSLKTKYLKKIFLKKLFFLISFCVISTAFTNAQILVKGNVKGAKNEPVIGVFVKLKDTNKGTVTDVDGNYNIEVPNAKSTLTFTSLSYVEQSITVGDKTVINVVLQEDSELLDEVVVIGFQTQKKVNLTAAVSSIDSKTFENRPVSNIGQALIGASPGLNINIAGNEPNKVPDLNIRGATTIRRKGTSNDDKTKFNVVSGSPLIMLDGIEISNEDLNQMNPADIDNISVLKDASAAAIYGTRATFGVILVQTKSGTFNQKARVNYTYDIGWDKPKGFPDILNSYTHYKSGLDKALWTVGTPYSEDNQEKLDYMLAYMNDPANNKPWYMKGDVETGTIQWAGNTNPYKELIKDWTPTQKHNFSVSGGGDRIAYTISLGAQMQEGMYKIGKDDLTRYNMMTNLTAKVTNRFKISTKVSHNIFEYKQPTKRGGYNLWGSIGQNSPEDNIYKPILTAWDDPIPNTPTENAASFLYAGGRSKTSRRTSIFSISPEFTIIPNELTIKGDFSLTPITYKSQSTNPRQGRVSLSWNPNALETREATENNGSVTKSTTDRYAINVYANYNKTFAEKHTVSALVGVNQERNEYSQSSISLKNMLDSNILNPSLVEDPTLNTQSVSNYITTARAIFGRVTYDYMSRYLFEFDARYDGSSRFPKSERFQTFPTFSLGWRISEEAFMKSLRPWLDNLKFRGSWGKLGSQPDGNYPYQSKYGTENGNYLFSGTRYPVGIKTPNIANPDLTWEKATSTNFGIDVTALKNRLDATLDIYQRVTSDILLGGAGDYSEMLGGDLPDQNGGKLRNRGFDFQIKWRDQLSNGLSYNVGFTLSDYKAKVTKDPSNPTKKLGEYTYEGMYLGEIWGYETGGILQKEDFEVNSSGKLVYKGPVMSGTQDVYPGYIWYHDLNGDGVINNGDNTANNPGDRRIIGNSTPRYRYSISAGAQYKGFDLDLLFQGVGKRDVWLPSTSMYWGTGAGSWDTYNDSWTPDNTSAKFPMYGTGVGSTTQTGYLINASYFTLRQVVLGYSLPKQLIERMKLSKLRFHVSAYNLFSISDIPKHMDLDYVQDAYPAKRTFSIGVQVGF